MKNILITGSAGFIGANLVLRLLESSEPYRIVGLDNLNDYYDPSLKEYRLRLIEDAATKHPEHSYTFVKGSIADRGLVNRMFEENKFDIVVNLAAQAGVRYSIENPNVYIESNVIGFYNILEACRHAKELVAAHNDTNNSQLSTTLNSPLGQRTLATNGTQELSTFNSQLSIFNYSGVKHLVYASSSSVYGGNKKVPFSVEDRVDNPVSLYAATKKSNELFAHCYSKLYNIPTTGLRFFTVYGPAGRPDMAYFGFTNKLLKGQTIQIYNYGNCRRDFTYVDDIVEGIVRVMRKAPEKKNGEDGLPIPPYAVYNIGGGQPENLLDFVNILQEELV